MKHVANLLYQKIIKYNQQNFTVNLLQIITLLVKEHKKLENKI